MTDKPKNMVEALRQISSCCERKNNEYPSWFKEEWLVVNCRQCGRSLLLERVSPQMLDADGELALSELPEVKCQYCKTVSVYQLDEIQIQKAQHKH